MWKIAGALALLVVSAAAAEETKKDPRETLPTAIPHAIKLLESEKYAEFLKDYVPPDDLRRVLAQTSLERFAESFAEQKAERLLTVLRAVKDRKPVLTEKGTVATFTLKEEKQGKDSIRFKRIGKRWYVQN